MTSTSAAASPARVWRSIQSRSRGRLRRAGDDEKPVGGEARHRDVALEAAAGVEHRRVDHAAGRDVHLVRAQALQDGEGISDTPGSVLADCLALLAQTSPDLVVVAVSWETLPVAIRTAIVALVQATAGAA